MRAAGICKQGLAGAVAYGVAAVRGGSAGRVSGRVPTWPAPSHQMRARRGHLLPKVLAQRRDGPLRKFMPSHTLWLHFPSTFDGKSILNGSNSGGVCVENREEDACCED